MPARGLLVQVGAYLGSVGKPPSFVATARTAWPCVSPAYLQASSFASQAPELLPDTYTRFSS